MKKTKQQHLEDFISEHLIKKVQNEYKYISGLWELAKFNKFRISKVDFFEAFGFDLKHYQKGR